MSYTRESMQAEKSLEPKLTNGIISSMTINQKMKLLGRMVHGRSIYVNAAFGNVPGIVENIQLGGNVEFRDENTGMTPLMIAASRGHVHTVKYLIEKARANYEARNYKHEGATTLMYATTYGHFPVVKYLIDKARVNVEVSYTINRTNALMIAAFYGHLLIVKYLIEKARADVDARNSKGWNVLHYAVMGNNSNSISVLKYMIEKAHADVEAKDFLGRTVLMFAVNIGSKNMMPLIKYLVEEAHADIDSKDMSKKTILMQAKEYADPVIFEYLELRQKQSAIPVGSLTSGVFGSNNNNNEKPRGTVFYDAVTMENTATSRYRRPIYVRRKRNANGKPIGHRKTEAWFTTLNSWMRMPGGRHPLTSRPINFSNLREYDMKRYKTATSSPERGSFAWKNMHSELSKINSNKRKKSTSTPPRSRRV